MTEAWLDGAGEAGTAESSLAMLSMLQLADSFFPSGLYTLSHGLESLIQKGAVTTAAQLEAVLEDYVTAVTGPSDAVAAAEASRAAAAGAIDTIRAIDEYLLSLKLAREAAMSSLRTGRRLLSVACTLSDAPVLRDYEQQVRTGAAPGNYAVALGILGAAWGLAPEQIALVELSSYVTGLLGAALRLMRLDHTQSQAILHRLQPLIARTAREAATMRYQEMWSFAPGIEIAQMQHERAELRLFVS